MTPNHKSEPMIPDPLPHFRRVDPPPELFRKVEHRLMKEGLLERDGFLSRKWVIRVAAAITVLLSVTNVWMWNDRRNQVTESTTLIQEIEQQYFEISSIYDIIQSDFYEE